MPHSSFFLYQNTAQHINSSSTHTFFCTLNFPSHGNLSLKSYQYWMMPLLKVMVVVVVVVMSLTGADSFTSASSSTERDTFLFPSFLLLLVFC